MILSLSLKIIEDSESVFLQHVEKGQNTLRKLQEEIDEAHTIIKRLKPSNGDKGIPDHNIHTQPLVSSKFSTFVDDETRDVSERAQLAKQHYTAMVVYYTSIEESLDGLIATKKIEKKNTQNKLDGLRKRTRVYHSMVQRGCRIPEYELHQKEQQEQAERDHDNQRCEETQCLRKDAIAGRCTNSQADNDNTSSGQLELSSTHSSTYNEGEARQVPGTEQTDSTDDICDAYNMSDEVQTLQTNAISV